MKTNKAYGDGFDVIIEDIINKHSSNPKSDRKSIQRMNELFLGINRINTLQFVYNKIREELKAEPFDKIVWLKFDCAKRLYFRTLNNIKNES
jgi:hypothetical protein